ncbi:hypothetical protein AURDEDRAFT_171004 [Auricularia subglabra TFB-10046 SS5]|nr:hypothetical protein AURDEDRAFT_171004 [Auricularia subglabra TFB-10046 SS5]
MTLYSQRTGGPQHVFPARCVLKLQSLTSSDCPNVASLRLTSHPDTMALAVSLWRTLFALWSRPSPTASGLPVGWRLADTRRDVFAEFCTEYIKGDLLLWARIVLPASGPVSDRLSYYADTWDLLCEIQRREAQDLLRGVKTAYVKALDLRTPSP